MTSSTTTYRHDYVPPLTGYELMKAIREQEARQCQLYCKEQQNIPKIVAKEKESEWTGVGVMGLLIEPRVIPSAPTPETIDQNTTNIQKNKSPDLNKSNDFLEIVRTCYPHIYERWLNWPKIKWQMDIDRNKTTYKREYRHLPIIPEEIIPDDGNTKYHRLENIMEETLPAECRDDYKPFNINFVSPNPLGRNEFIYGPYTLDPEKPPVTEYTDKISRTGCTITQSRLHNHNKACKIVCAHKYYPCETIK